MEYIIVNEETGRITGHLCGGQKPEGAIEVPDGFPGFIGILFAALKDDLSGVKPISQQVAEGILTIPEGFKANAEDNELIRMEQDEIDAIAPVQTWAIPGEFHVVTVHKSFDRFGNFGYFPPDGAVQMQEQQPTVYHKAEVDGTWTPDVDRAKAAKLETINTAYNAATSALVSTYPQTELLTFDKQEAEARAWTADNSVETPLVDMLSEGRQMDKSELIRRILAKADAFALATGYLTGQRQRYEDMVKAAETAEAVAAIVPVYTMPDMGEATDTETSSETPELENPSETEATV